MRLVPIQLTDSEVLIPLDYFGNETELEIFVDGAFAHVRAKSKPQTKPRLPGSAIGKIELSEGFFDPLPEEILDLFE